VLEAWRCRMVSEPDSFASAFVVEAVASCKRASWVVAEACTIALVVEVCKAAFAALVGAEACMLAWKVPRVLSCVVVLQEPWGPCMLALVVGVQSNLA